MSFKEIWDPHPFLSFFGYWLPPLLHIPAMVNCGTVGPK
jgi:hypothetical protein